MAARLDPAEWLIPVGFGLTAASVGIVAGIAPIAAIAAAVAIALVLMTLASLTVGLIGFVTLSFLELVPSLTGPALSLAKLAGGVLALSWIASAASFGKQRREFPVAHVGLMAAFFLLVAWTLLSFSWAEDQTRVPTAAFSFLLNFILFPIVYAAIGTKRDVAMVFGAFVAGAALAALYGLITQPSAAGLANSASAAGGLNRLSGTVADPNEFATLLVAGMAVATGLLFSRERPAGVRILSGFAIALLVLSVLLSLSRGGLVAMAAALLVGMFFTYRSRGKAILAASAVVLAAMAFFAANPVAYERVTDSDGGSGRTDVWQVGWRMVQDEPLRGVGAGNFQVSSIHYLIAPGTIRYDEYIVDQPVVAHNMYLGVLAELGVVGFCLFIGIILACIGMMIRAFLIYSRGRDHEGAILVAAVVMATSALMAGYFFLSQEHSKHLWLLLSFGPALLALARRDAGGEHVV